MIDQFVDANKMVRGRSKILFAILPSAGDNSRRCKTSEMQRSSTKQAIR